MAAELKKELGLEATLHQSYGGVFEVEVGGDLIFSKSKSGRFPNQSEVLELLKEKQLR
ncbi:MAG: Rdx family protein [Candidatus Melainabacteria bacterium]|uniref:Rdx family protein n=1 Tax=Candidatus Obscuribacter phosphatis TaxID=1906157 RepID=A0A8J7PNG6_9BACT|nr:Rdx family protein [Candidatus Obscuribacter phosphatis]MBX9941329.1 Rdx family protein [Candidatus Obscuribacterales bacterium]MCA0312480.1 Rdx family protein [Candidatus Melainabacteria bacterium]OPZ89108.1 MAG: Rdx family protein [bacterium ADurb.Bin425]